MTESDLRKKIAELLKQRKEQFIEEVIRFAGNASDDEDMSERILDVATVTRLDGRDPVLDRITRMYSEKDGSLLGNIWAVGDTIQELENLQRIAGIKEES